MNTTFARASLIALLATLGHTAAAQSKTSAAPATAPAAPAAPAAPPAAPAPAAAAPAAAPAPAPTYPPPPGYPPPPAYAPGYGPTPGAPLDRSPMYGPPPPYGAPPPYGPPPGYYTQPPRPYPPPPPAPPRPEGTAGFVGDAMVGLAWDIGVPIGSVHDFTSNVSPAGFDLSLRYWLHPRITIGGEVEWQTFRDDKPRTTYEFPYGALTATAYNSVQTGSLRATAHYYFLDRGPVLPYVGVNIGYGWSTFQSVAADIALYDNQDSVVLGAEVGGLLSFGHRRAPLVLVAARYSAAPSMEFLSSVKDVQAITFQLGLLLH